MDAQKNGNIEVLSLNLEKHIFSIFYHSCLFGCSVNYKIDLQRHVKIILEAFSFHMPLHKDIFKWMMFRGGKETTSTKISIGGPPKLPATINRFHRG